MLSDCLSCISPEPPELQKSYLHLFPSSSEELLDKIRNPVTKSADICKNAVLTEKSKLLEKSTILKNSKTFFHASNVYELNLHTNHFLAQNRHATSSSQARCVYPNFVNLIFHISHLNDYEMKKTFL